MGVYFKSSTALVKEMSYCYSAVQFIHLFTVQFSIVQLIICLSHCNIYL